MREFQTIQSILANGLIQANESNAKRIKTVQLALGEMAELDQNSIRHQWAVISKGTSAEQAELRFRFIQARVQCMACFREYDPIDGKIHCPHCGSYGAKVLRGEEFYLESVEWDDE